MKLTLKEKRQETSDVTSFIFESSEPVEWKAGQYLHYILHHPNMDDRKDERWFTISAAPYEGHIMLTTRFTTEHGSSFKAALKNLKAGDSLEADGIEGDFTLDDPSKSYVFLAGGIGITPFRSIILELQRNGQPVNITLLYANRNNEIVFKDELEQVAGNHPEFKIHYILDPQRIDEETITQFVPDLENRVFYVSGPEPMVESLGQTLKSMGIPEENIKQDWFPGYPGD